MANEPIQGGPYPEPIDPPDGPGQMSAIVGWAAGRSVMRFASIAARDAALPAPVDGMLCYVAADNGYYVRAGGEWRVLFAPPRAYTPTFSANITVGNGTVQGEWSQVGDVVHWWARFVLGSTSVVAGLPIISLPKPPAHGLASSIGTTAVGTLLLRDASAAGAASRRAMTVLSDYTSDPQTAWGINAHDGTGVTASAPWSWAAGDSMDYSGSYKVAS